MVLDFTSLLWLAVASVTLYYCLGKRRKNYPPGPWRLPVLGNLLSTRDRMHLAFERYYRKYGPIFSVKLANEEAVVLHGAQLIREAFKNPTFDGRPEKEAGELFLSGSKAGIILGNGRSWTEQRRFALRHLRDFGIGKSSIEGLIMDEVRELISWIKKQNGKPISLHRRFSLAVVNVLWTALSGKRYEQDDPRLSSILDQLEATAGTLFGGAVKSLLIFFYPKIAKRFPNWSGWNFLLKSIEPRKKFFEETILEHKRTFQDGQPRDFIDVYLQEVKNTQDPDSSFNQETADNALQSVMADFFLAGSDTTSTTLNWAILHLIHYSEVQFKLQQEIDRVVGKSRLPSLADRSGLPYTEAFIMELMRMTSITAFGAPHAVTEDVEFHGFHIPKGTSVYSSLYTTHHDPEVWGDPENFRPERFLSKDGSKVEKHDSLIPFSIGRRDCIGQLLARDQLLLFVTSFVQHFDIISEPGKIKPTLNVKFGQLTLEPHHYDVVMNNRL